MVALSLPHLKLDGPAQSTDPANAATPAEGSEISDNRKRKASTLNSALVQQKGLFGRVALQHLLSDESLTPLAGLASFAGYEGLLGPVSAGMLSAMTGNHGKLVCLLPMQNGLDRLN